MLIFLNVLAMLRMVGTTWVYEVVPVHAKPVSSVNDSSQLILVVGKHWRSSEAVLQRFERSTGSPSEWKPVGTPYAVSIGNNGFAWGIGKHDQTGLLGPVMDEGDMRTPAGIFPVSGSFGYQPRAEVGSLKVPYTQLTDYDVCVDDPESQYYNQVISTTKVSRSAWKSGEEMTQGGGYKLAILFDQNPAPSVARRGSCLYIHVGPTEGGTYGCTTLGENELREILSWLDITKKPMLAQLPEHVFRRVYKDWGLPEPDQSS